ncbi:MAG: hypothetical protein H3C68_03705 [Deltaproteobacteria bacterium]|nr:hypothetical protein [Deltaproteobacteria bacterium]MBZ0219829.1 hypothetical protein [Deltaproteobacteria bacterium]
MGIDRLRAAKAISIVVAAGGLIEMSAWWLGVEFLKTLAPGYVTMKFSTALSFLLSGVVLYYFSEAARGEMSGAQVALPISTLVILLLMSTLLASALFGLEAGVEALFVMEDPSAVMTEVPGVPSIATMLDFILISALAIAVLFRQRVLPWWFRSFGAFIALTGLSALMGYLLDMPRLYFFFPGLSGAMAIPTSILFVLIGICLFIIPGARR